MWEKGSFVTCFEFDRNLTMIVVTPGVTVFTVLCPLEANSRLKDELRVGVQLLSLNDFVRNQCEDEAAFAITRKPFSMTVRDNQFPLVTLYYDWVSCVYSLLLHTL